MPGWGSVLFIPSCQVHQVVFQSMQRLIRRWKENTFCGVYRADADLRLLSKSKPPSDAFSEKIIWIVGASQVIVRYLA